MNAPTLPPPDSATDITETRRRRLTDRQRICLEFIEQTIVSKGYPPTLREIGAHMGIRSTNGVNDHLRAIERKGYIKRDDLKSRGITTLVRSPNLPEISATVDAWQAETTVLRRLLERTRDMLSRTPMLSGEAAILLGDIRAVLKTRTP